MNIVVATGNAGKVREIREILAPLGYTVQSMKERGIELEVEETGSTFAENAYLKAKAIFDLCGEMTMADDSGLEVDALGGAPGVYSARYAGEGHDDQANNRKLLAALEQIQDRRAHFTCAICCVYPGGNFTVEGRCEGVIAREPAGEGGFGYDPLFYVEQYGKTFGELTSEEKNAISHRGEALRAFACRLEEIKQTTEEK
ncbi:MAG: XTP/dITP diphosphatase [Eubacteriales bacterium]|jgi:XTP/dITP diphosphohydrolase